MTISERLLEWEPSEPKKSMRITCVPLEVLPTASLVDQSPPTATCANTRAPAPPINDVAGSNPGIGAGDGLGGGKPRPKPVKGPADDAGIEFESVLGVVD